MIAGEPYDARDPELVEARRHAARCLQRYNTTPSDDDAMRAILRDLLGALGDGVELRPPFACDYGFNIAVGARTFANFNLIVLDVAPVSIGNDVQIGPSVQLLTATHPLDANLRRSGIESGKPITIEDNVWLGGGVIVCPGVTIGANTVVGAGSVVVRSLPPGVLAVGNPARVVRAL
jgi:maltose O-acetyltransferase